MSLRLSQHQACLALHVGLRLPFVHPAAPYCVPHSVGAARSVAHCHARSCLLYPRGPRSGLGSIVPVQQRLIGLIRPTRRHIPVSPHCGLTILFKELWDHRDHRLYPHCEDFCGDPELLHFVDRKTLFHSGTPELTFVREELDSSESDHRF